MSSPSTLIRKAKAAEAKGHLRTAKRLREEAAKMRRNVRKRALKHVKAPKRKKAKKKVHYADKIERALTEAMKVLPPEIDMMAKSPLDFAVDRLCGLNASEAERIIARRELIEARKIGENNAAAKYAAQKEAHDISTVCGFIAIAEYAAKLNGNLPPTMAVSGYMAAKLVDALRKAGYTRDGLNGGGTTREANGARVGAGRKEWQVYESNRPE